MQTKHHHRKRPWPHKMGPTPTPPPKLRRLQLQQEHPPHASSSAVDSLVAACRADAPVPAALTSWCFHGRRVSGALLHVAQCPMCDVPEQLQDLHGSELRSYTGTALVVLQHGAGTYHEWIMRM